MDKHIKIENLTDEQLEMLDIIWSLRTKEAVEEWFSELAEDDRQMAVTLINLLRVELIDTENRFTTQKSLMSTKKYLKKFQL